MDEQSRSSCGEQAAVQRRGLLAQTGLTLLCVTMAECLCRPSLCPGFSLKVFYLLLHQPAAPDRQQAVPISAPALMFLV